VRAVLQAVLPGTQGTPTALVVRPEHLHRDLHNTRGSLFRIKMAVS